MIIYIGADHKGFSLKESLKKYLQENGYTVSDMGNTVLDPNDDYPDFAVPVAEKVSMDPEGSKGILICGSGVGVDVVANKFPRIRSSLVVSPDHAFLSRKDDNANVLSLPADLIDEQAAKMITATWLQTPFSEEVKYKRRIAKIRDIEQKAKDM
ncbi:MAG: RpiB/LacA/LacB family sugar-phosphate isomerase [Candidatus Colwellbacteria bacterium]|jgi:RpiB/LacA/LacB family sugar-phosphate isomerase|nr:RpiB/LacA/LacB family sugar-phosphate isomerase [Candidatus Colwellbacteria bacterium]MDD3752869.1 RpiB/LacA/LacB family sugar-phosphate isomerase [Candidatus Colwellbacteria bacterium]MDD4819054.1 RpiB/LacA/LacB family sugar-phosphate isomerase [Candidatus Colwellbacteria bacterium]